MLAFQIPLSTRLQFWIDRQAAASPSSLVVMLSSPAVRFLLDWKENEASAPESRRPCCNRRRRGMRRVFDQRETVRVRDALQGVPRQPAGRQNERE